MLHILPQDGSKLTQVECQHFFPLLHLSDRECWMKRQMRLEMDPCTLKAETLNIQDGLIHSNKCIHTFSQNTISPSLPPSPSHTPLLFLCSVSLFAFTLPCFHSHLLFYPQLECNGGPLWLFQLVLTLLCFMLCYGSVNMLSVSRWHTVKDWYCS